MTVTPDRQPVPEEPVGAEARSMRRLGRDTLVYLSGTVLARAVSFLMLPVYTRYLTTTDYGLLQMLDLVVEVAAILVSAGATAGAMRFYFKARTEGERKDILATAFWVQVGLNGIGTLLILLAAPTIWNVALDGQGSITMVRIAALNFTLGVMAGVPMLLYQARQQPGRFVAINLIRLVLQLSLNILFVVVLKQGPLGVLLSSCITHALLGLFLAVNLLRYTGLRFSVVQMVALRRYGIPVQITTAGTFILTFGDRLFLKHYHDLAVVGLYGIAYQFGFLLAGNVAAPFLRAWNPQRHMLVHAPKAVRDERYNRGFFYGSLMLVTAATLLSLFIRPVLAIMVTPAFRPAANIVPIILAAFLIQWWKDVVEFGVQVSERTKYSTYAAWISVVVIVILYALLIPPLAGLGAALATLLAFMVRFALQLHWSQKLWPVSYDWRPHRRLLAAGTAVVALAYLLAPTGLLLQSGVGAILSLVYAGAVWLTVLGPGERRTVKQILRSPRTFSRLLAAE